MGAAEEESLMLDRVPVVDLSDFVDPNRRPLFIRTLGEGLEHVDTLFTALFTAELVINAYAHWFRSSAAKGTATAGDS